MGIELGTESGSHRHLTDDDDEYWAFTDWVADHADERHGELCILLDQGYSVNFPRLLEGLRLILDENDPPEEIADIGESIYSYAQGLDESDILFIQRPA